MFTTNVYSKVLTMSIFGIDAYFDVIVEKITTKTPAWILDQNVDTFDVVTRDSGKVRITVKPTDKFHNALHDYETLSVVMDVDLARKVVIAIRDESYDHMWFVKDLVNYADKHGEII